MARFGGGRGIFLKDDPQVKELEAVGEELERRLTELAEWIVNEGSILCSDPKRQKHCNSTVITFQDREVKVAARSQLFTDDDHQKYIFVLTEDFVNSLRRE